MRTPDEIKKALRICQRGSCKGCDYRRRPDNRPCIDVMDDDALAYIQQLEAELIATRVQLAKDGELCRICKAQGVQDCVGDCIGCDNTECCCKRCIDTDGKEGFEWDGGAE